MIILGLDPGTRRVGYGLVEKSGPALRLIEAGLLSVKASTDAAALLEIKRGADGLLKKFKPDMVALEKLFFTKNQKTGIQVAEARGVLLLAAMEYGAPVREYAPNEIKSSVAGYGGADKRAVAKMVRLTLAQKELSVIDDASDALAVAIMAAGDVRGLV